jgi:hypothetical protein
LPGERGLAADVAAKAGEPLLDVGGISDLAELAIAHDRDSRRFLLRDRILDGRLDEPLERRCIVGLALIAGEQQRRQLSPPRQAADVCCQDIRHERPVAFCRQYIQICRKRARARNRSASGRERGNQWTTLPH